MFSSLNGGVPTGIGRPGLGTAVGRALGSSEIWPVAALAVEEVELGEHALLAAAGVAIEGQRALQGHGLAHRPGLHAAGDRLALGVVGVDVVVPLQGAEQVELEGDPRVAGGHDLVADELAVAGAAEVAVQADRGARLGIVQRDHAAGDIGRVAGAQRVVAGQPAAGAAVAGLAADAVGDLELGAAPAGGGIGVAAEAGRRRSAPGRGPAGWRSPGRAARSARARPGCGRRPRCCGSCQVISSFWRTTRPLATGRLWQMEPAHDATPSWTPEPPVWGGGG